MNEVQASGNMPDAFDRALGVLGGSNEVLRTKPTTIQNVPALGVGGTMTYVVQTVRHAELGDTIFLQVIGGRETVRLALPDKVSATIGRQRDALTARARSQAAREAARNRRQNGAVPPGFTPEARAKAAATRAAKAAKRRARRKR